MSKKPEIIEKMHFVEAMRTYNPLAFKKPDGQVEVYKDWCCAYVEMLERCYTAAPKGYLDCLLFLIDNYGMNRGYAKSFLVNFIKSGALDDETEFPFGVILVDWKGDFEEQMRRFAVGLHNVTETRLQNDKFKEAVRIFKHNHNF